jgi:hypothetical protein
VDEFSDATALVNWRFQWLWLYHESISEYRRNKGVDTAICQHAAFRASLANISPSSRKVESKKRVVLVVDGAGEHLSESVKIPLGIHLYCLPSHSPELQPAERLWSADKGTGRC